MPYIRPNPYSNYGEFGLVRIQKTRTVNWEARVPGQILGTSTKNGNILVIYTPEWKDQNDRRKVIKSLHASLINGADGKIIVDKIIHSNPAKNISKRA